MERVLKIRLVHSMIEIQKKDIKVEAGQEMLMDHKMWEMGCSNHQLISINQMRIFES